VLKIVDRFVLKLLVLAASLAIVAIVIVVVVVIAASTAIFFVVAVDVQILQVALETAANVVVVIPFLIHIDTVDVVVIVVIDPDNSLLHAVIAAPVVVVVAGLVGGGVFEFAYIKFAESVSGDSGETNKEQKAGGKLHGGMIPACVFGEM